ncbi:hypothetical protein MFMK1_000934 [Metallumcola ferriviriculae]|uniref:Holin n=1 Tax=Metallumcola ferriviriculae TaxID=3039180 RepID=A0AAU0UKL2_9FIRM|nr:hypothetical protein MFMK1_000934 [Desulfitibacteraceae bacterium MK1]
MKLLWVMLVGGMYTGIFVYQGLPLLRNKQIKDGLVFSGLLSMGFALTVLQILGVKIPSPADYIEAFIKFLLGWFNGAGS